MDEAPNSSRSPSERSPRERISLPSISEKLTTTPRPPTFHEFKSTRFAEILLWSICGLAAIFLAAWWFSRPSLDEVRQIFGTAANGKELLEALQNLRTQHFNEFRDLFQLLVLSGLVPLFTLVAGYAFGLQQKEKQGQG